MVVGLVTGIAGPGDAYAQWPFGGMPVRPGIWELRAFLPCQPGVSTEIGTLPGDGFRRGLKDCGKAHQRAFEIELRRRIAEHSRFDRAGAHRWQGAHQALDRLLHLENGHAAARCNERSVAAELDGIAEALLGVE